MTRAVGTALMFLTRLPVARYASDEPAALTQSVMYFPLVGLIVALTLAVSYLVCASVFPVSLAIALVLVVSTLLTGAFHEDGLADVADSAGAFGLDRKLEIMRDSRVGTYGSLALVLITLVKYASLVELANLSTPAIAGALIAAHVLSRWSSVLLMARVSYARPEASNRVVADGVDHDVLKKASLVGALCLLATLPLIGTGALLSVPVALGISALASIYFKRWFGGITGDCLGACNQLVEVGILMTLLGWLS